VSDEARQAYRRRSATRPRLAVGVGRPRGAPAGRRGGSPPDAAPRPAGPATSARQRAAVWRADIAALGADSRRRGGALASADLARPYLVARAAAAGPTLRQTESAARSS
jgi:hypothetical protein